MRSGCRWVEGWQGDPGGGPRFGQVVKCGSCSQDTGDQKGEQDMKQSRKKHSPSFKARATRVALEDLYMADLT